MTADTHKSLLEVRTAIQEEVKKLDVTPYSDSIITINLQIANDKFGVAVKDKLIDEFGLEKLGWRKDSDVIKRRGEFDFDKPL